MSPWPDDVSQLIRNLRLNVNVSRVFLKANPSEVVTRKRPDLPVRGALRLVELQQLHKAQHDENMTTRVSLFRIWRQGFLLLPTRTKRGRHKRLVVSIDI